MEKNKFCRKKNNYSQGVSFINGKLLFQSVDGSDEIKVEFTFGYVKDKDNNLLINLHHSSIPYTN